MIFASLPKIILKLVPLYEHSGFKPNLVNYEPDITFGHKLIGDKLINSFITYDVFD